MFLIFFLNYRLALPFSGPSIGEQLQQDHLEAFVYEPHQPRASVPSSIGMMMMMINVF